jgi:hypothetical protein
MRHFYGNPHVFVSGLAMLPLGNKMGEGSQRGDASSAENAANNAVAISYGVNDEESRLMVATEKFLESHFV